MGNTEGRTEGEAVGTDVVGGRVGNVVGTLVIQTESPLQTRCNIRYNSSTVRSQVVSFSCGATRGVHNPQVFGQILAIEKLDPFAIFLGRMAEGEEKERAG